MNAQTGEGPVYHSSISTLHAGAPGCRYQTCIHCKPMTYDLPMVLERYGPLELPSPAVCSTLSSPASHHPAPMLRLVRQH